jgi:hypothetical protein
MKYLGMFVVIVWLLAACNYQPVATPDAGELEAQAGFVDVGGALDVSVNRISEQSSLALNSAGRPVVAWVEYNASDSGFDYDDKLYVKQWNGSQWVRLGASLSNVNRVDNPSIAVTSTGYPIVAYERCLPDRQQCYATDSPPDIDIFVKQWDGSKWLQLGGELTTPTLSRQSRLPALAVDAQNRPVVAYSECLEYTGDFCTGYDLYVKRWDGSKWVVLGTALNVQKNVAPVVSGSYASGATVALDGLGRIVVAWQEGTTTASPRVYAKRWNGSSWTLLGSAVDRNDTNPVRYNYKPSLVIDKKTNTPYVAYVDYIPATNDDNLYVMKFDGSKWVQVSSNIDSAGSKVDNPSLSLTPDSRPMVAYDESYNGNRNIYIKVLSLGGTWGYVGARVERTITNNAYLPSLAVDATGNAIFSYEEEVAGQQRNVYVRKYQPDVPKSWTFLGGKINYSNGAGNPLLDFDSSSNPIAVWTELQSLPQGLYRRLYAKRWDGSNWLPLGQELNVSNKNVFEFSLAVAKTNNPIAAWSETTLENQFGNRLNADIYVKRWNGSAWVRLGGALDKDATKIAEVRSVVLDSSGVPVVMWEECTQTYTDPNNGDVSCQNKSLYVKRWNGNAWISLDAALTSFGPYAGTTSFADRSFQMVAGQSLFVAWRELTVSGSASSYAIEVRRWDGSNWVKLTSIPTLRKYSEPSFSLAADSGGQPAIAWASCTKIFVGGVNNDEISCIESTLFVRRWNGSVWEKRGEDIVTTELYSSVDLKMETPTNPVVQISSCLVEFCGSDAKVKIFRWGGSGWTDIAISLNDNNAQTSPGFFTLDSANNPVIVWFENLLSGDLNIRVRRYQ